MIVLHCTKKVLSEMGVAELSLAAPSNIDSAQHWYVHLFLIERKKCLIFTHAGSLFSFVVTGLGRYQIKNSLSQIFKKELEKAMFYEEFSADEIRQVSESINPISLAKTETRNTIGSMNEFIWYFKCYVDDNFGLANSDVNSINQKLNGTPMRLLKKYCIPVEKFKEIVKSNACKSHHVSR